MGGKTVHPKTYTSKIILQKLKQNKYISRGKKQDYQTEGIDTRWKFRSMAENEEIIIVWVNIKICLL